MENIFEPIVDEANLNPDFELLRNGKQLDPAKLLIAEITSEMEDNDGNFIQQFQTTGFDSRLW